VVWWFAVVPAAMRTQHLADWVWATLDEKEIRLVHAHCQPRNATGKSSPALARPANGQGLLVMMR